MMKITLVPLLFLLSTCTPYSPRSAGPLLGLKEGSSRIDEMKKKLGIFGTIGGRRYTPGCYAFFRSLGHAVSLQYGIGLTFDNGKLIEVWFDHLDRENGCGVNEAYTGSLPMGITRKDTRRSILRKLGKPESETTRELPFFCYSSRETKERQILYYHNGKYDVGVVTGPDDTSRVSRVILTLHDKSRFALEGDVRFGNDEDQKRCGQEYENERGRQAVLRYRNLKRAIEEDKRRQAERREREDRDAASARKEKEAEALRMAEMTRTAMSGGCRKGTEYIGCYRLGNYCASFSGYSSRNLTLSSVAEAAARLIYAENFPFRKRRSDVEGSARAILSKCDGLPVTNITDLCDSEGVRSSCVRKNRFNLDN